MKPLIRIIIPTFNNPEFLNPCVESIIRTGILQDMARLTIVNNGKQPIKQMLANFPHIDVIDSDVNLGWEGGLDIALKDSDEPFVCFQNDDTFIPIHSIRFYQRLLTAFSDKTVGAIGPATTTAAGPQSIFAGNAPCRIVEVPFLIFFTVMLRREYLENVGGVDTSLPGGDDLDVSIRLRNGGYKLLLDPASFIIHHGFKTGARVHGDGYAGVKDGWNSQEMSERTNTALIKKHGFKNWFTLFSTPIKPYTSGVPCEEDIEGKLIAGLVGNGDVVELGCGSRKTVPHALGVDRVVNGDEIPHVGTKSVADVQADVSGVLPFDDFSKDAVICRHILEHCLDTVQTLKNWNRILRMGGKLLIAVPDEEVVSGIPLNAEHCHAFTAESLRSVAEACGFKEIKSLKTGNGISFIGYFEKVEHFATEREMAHV